MMGDVDPEDAYDVTDPPAVRFETVALWVASVALEQARPDHDHDRVMVRIHSARWAAGLLAVAKLTKRQDRRLAALRDWLDDLLNMEGP